MAKKKQYDWKITAKKFGIDAAIVFLAGIISVYENNAAWLSIIPLAKALLNILKNYRR